MRMWNNSNSHTLPVGLYNYTATIEKSFGICGGGGPLRKKCLDIIRYSRGLLRKTFVRVGRRRTGESEWTIGLWHRSNLCEEERKVCWEEVLDCNTLIRNFEQSWAKVAHQLASATLRNNPALVSLPISVIIWEQLLGIMTWHKHGHEDIQSISSLQLEVWKMHFHGHNNPFLILHIPTFPYDSGSRFSMVPVTFLP